MPSYIRDELKSLAEEFRSACQRHHTELRETREMLAQHILEDARRFASMQSEHDTKKAISDRHLGLLSLLVAVATLIVTILKEFR